MSEARTATDSVSTEERVMEWCSELLDEKVGREDNFLDLGGHSMLAVMLNERVNERYGIDLDIQILFEGTIAEVAESIESATDPSLAKGAAE